MQFSEKSRRIPPLSDPDPSLRKAHLRSRDKVLPPLAEAHLPTAQAALSSFFLPRRDCCYFL